MEESLKKEIKRGNLILYEKIDKLETEIKSLNLENEMLKKDLFKEKKRKARFSKYNFSNFRYSVIY